MTCCIVTDGTELSIKCKNEKERIYYAIKERLREIIWELYCEGFHAFCLNCEYGIPLWSAEIICGFKVLNPIKLHAVIPYEDQPMNWYEEYRDRYYRVLEQADTVKTINTGYHTGCYFETDNHMLTLSNLLIVVGCSYDQLYSVHIAKHKNIETRFYKFNYS